MTRDLGVLLLILSVLATVGYGVYTFFSPSFTHLAVTATAAVVTIGLALKVTRNG